MSGKHYILDLYEVPIHLLRDNDFIEKTIKEAAIVANATILNSYFHKFGGAGGVTGVLALAESHISIHTWPENQFASIDAFMCGKSNPLLACQFMIQSFLTSNFKLNLIERGNLINTKSF